MTERQIHKAIIDYLRLALPAGSFVTTIPGGDGARTQAPGYVKGTPDIVAIVPSYPAIFIEVKGPRGRSRPQQDAVADALHDAGAVCFVARDIRDVARGLGELAGIAVRARS